MEEGITSKIQNCSIYKTIIQISAILLFSCGEESDFNIVKSNIGFNNNDTEIFVLEETELFSSDQHYKTYFSSSSIDIDSNNIIHISTRAFNDDDFAKTDFVRIDQSNGKISNQVLFKENEASLGTVNPSIIKIDKKILLFYLNQDSHSQIRIMMQQSFDNAASWTPPKEVSMLKGFNNLSACRAIVLSSGRIFLPISFTTNIMNNYKEQKIFGYYSDDYGNSWKVSTSLTSSVPLMEPCVAEITPGKLIMAIRSKLGKLLFSESYDNGITWTKVKKSQINAPASTSAIYTIDRGRLLLIWNNSKPGRHVFDRTPLSISISADQGKSWSKPYNIANSPNEMYSSPSLLKIGKHYLITYNRSKDASHYDIIVKKFAILN